MYGRMIREVLCKSQPILETRAADTISEISSVKEAMELSCETGTHILMPWLEQRTLQILSPGRDETRVGKDKEMGV